MAVFPLFVELKAKKCMVIGGGKVAERKITILLEFGAEIEVISPRITENIKRLNDQGRLAVFLKRYETEDLQGAFLVIAATSDPQLNKKIYHDATTNKIMINIVDCPDKCTFIFPSIIKRANLVIGFSTSGYFPVLARKLRQKMEQVIPEFYGNIFDVLKECRERAGKEIPDPERRSELLNRIAGAVVLQESLTPDQLRMMINDIFREYLHETEN